MEFGPPAKFLVDREALLGQVSASICFSGIARDMARHSYTFWSSILGGMSEATPVGPLALQALSLRLNLHRWNCSVYGL